MDTEVIKKIVVFIKNEMPTADYSVLQNLSNDDNIFRNITHRFSNNKGKLYRSTVIRLVKRNQSFKNIFQGICYQKKHLKDTDIKSVLSDLLYCIHNRNCRDKRSVYGQLCVQLKTKNIYKNRMKFYLWWHHIIANFNCLINFNVNECCSYATTFSSSVFHSTPVDACCGVSDDREQFSINNIAHGNHSQDSNGNSFKYQTSLANNDSSQFILNLESVLPKTSKVLPTSSNNSPLLINLGFQHCNILEGTFNIAESVWKNLYNNNKLDTNTYTYYIRNYIGSYVNNICIIAFKYVKYLKRSPKIVIYAKCIHPGCKKFKIIIINKTVSVYTNSINFHHEKMLTSYVKGIDRKLVKQQLLYQKPSLYKRDTLFQCDDTITKVTFNLKNIKSDATIRKIRSETLAQFDKDIDDVLDLVKLQSEHKYFVREICFPFNLKLYGGEQLTVLSSVFKEQGELYVHFDATGNIVRHPYKENKRVLLYAGVIHLHATGRIFPIFSMLSSQHDSNSIFKILHDFRYFCEEQNGWPLFSGVVTDFSFANLHAISKAFNRITLLEYLIICFKLCSNQSIVEDKDKFKDLVTIHLCCAHFMKNVSKDVNNLAKNKEQQILFKELIAGAVNIKCVSVFNKWFKYMTIVLSSPVYNKIVRNALHILLILSDKKQLNEPFEDDHDDVELSLPQQNYTYESSEKSLYSSSPFFQNFKKIFEINKCELKLFSNDHTKNVYYNIDILNIILKKYLPYCPLWSCIMPRTNRKSNAVIENYFGGVKKYCLDNQKGIKASRFVKKHFEEVLSLSKEIKLNIPKSNLCRKSREIKRKLDPSDEKLSQESWNKRLKKGSSYFVGRHLKSLKGDLEFLTVGSDELDANLQFQQELGDDFKEVVIDDVTRCAYCGKGKFSEVTRFVQCDTCNEWIHTLCETSDENNSFSEEFVCKLCNGSVTQVTNDKPDTHLFEKCTQEIQRITITDFERTEIANSTIAQSNCKTWITERQSRLTSSFFGRICTCRESRKSNIVQAIRNPKSLNIPALCHGRVQEAKAREQYCSMYNVECHLSGLQIHKEFPFLAGSPDGLVEDKLIEIKCPYKYRYVDPNCTKFSFLNKQGILKTNNNYYYQIQGLLEICNQRWCDLVIFTFKGIRVIKVKRNNKFWEDIMLPKLKAFYYFDFLPAVIYPSKQLSLQDRKWRTYKDIVFLENGLVADINYYQNTTDMRSYTVAYFENIPCIVKEIIIDDFLTLNPKIWLSSFIIDVCLHLFNVNNKFQILSVELSTILYASDKLSKDVLKLFSVNSNYIAMPFLENNNHYLLAIIDIEEKTFSLLDPFGKNYHKQQLYLNKFCNLLNASYAYKTEPHNWKLTCPEYILQTDTWNCGMYIIYYFKNICQNKSLLTYVDMDNYRSELKYFLLSKSSMVAQRCLYCNKPTHDEYFKCNMCCRFIHAKCLTSTTDTVSPLQKFKNNLCNLCHSY